VFRGLFSSKKALTGAPASPRMKTYPAASGYVYHYFFEGRREDQDAEYVFRISTGCTSWRLVAIMLPGNMLAGWQREAARSLSASERYAIAKLALFDVFDGHDVPEAIPKTASVSRTSLDAIAATLGWD
jgi:hypothetical protein